jgi:t-SNARE complex subunit (syntaxin)
MMMDKEKQNYEKTKRILYDLSSLNTTIQKKLFEQSEMTKNILFNSFKSVDNVEQGNKHLTKAKEYQKGRGLIIGIIFIILGLFLIISDR